MCTQNKNRRPIHFFYNQSISNAHAIYIFLQQITASSQQCTVMRLLWSCITPYIQSRPSYAAMLLCQLNSSNCWSRSFFIIKPQATFVSGGIYKISALFCAWGITYEIVLIVPKVSASLLPMKAARRANYFVISCNFSADFVSFTHCSIYSPFLCCNEWDHVCRMEKHRKGGFWQIRTSRNPSYQHIEEVGTPCQHQQSVCAMWIVPEF